MVFYKKGAGAKALARKKAFGGAEGIRKGIFWIILRRCNQYLLLLFSGLSNLCWKLVAIVSVEPFNSKVLFSP